MGSLSRKEKMVAFTAALFYKSKDQKHRVTTKETQHLCLHSLDYIALSKYPRTLIEPGSFHP